MSAHRAAQNLASLVPLSQGRRRSARTASVTTRPTATANRDLGLRASSARRRSFSARNESFSSRNGTCAVTVCACTAAVQSFRSPEEHAPSECSASFVGRFFDGSAAYNGGCGHFQSGSRRLGSIVLQPCGSIVTGTQRAAGSSRSCAHGWLGRRTRVRRKGVRCRGFARTDRALFRDAAGDAVLGRFASDDVARARAVRDRATAAVGGRRLRSQHASALGYATLLRAARGHAAAARAFVFRAALTCSGYATRDAVFGGPTRNQRAPTGA